MSVHLSACLAHMVIERDDGDERDGTGHGTIGSSARSFPRACSIHTLDYFFSISRGGSQWVLNCIVITEITVIQT